MARLVAGFVDRLVEFVGLEQMSRVARLGPRHRRVSVAERGGVAVRPFTGPRAQLTFAVFVGALVHQSLVGGVFERPQHARDIAQRGVGPAALVERLSGFAFEVDQQPTFRCPQHLPEMHQGAFDDARTRLLHEDARAFLEKTTDRFDLIVVDLVEPLEEGPACLLFTKEFYALIRDRLTDQGVMTMQAGMTKVNEIFFHGAVNRTLREVFPVVAPYQSFISCFGTPWGFILASKGTDPRRQSAAEIDRLIAERLDPKQLGYWDGQAHLHSFNLPKFLRVAIEKNDRVITDKNLLIVS